MLSKQNYFLVDCLTSFGKAPGRNIFRAARLFQTYYMSVKFRIKLCHGYDFLCLNWILNTCWLAFVYVWSFDTVAIFFGLPRQASIFAQSSSRFAVGSNGVSSFPLSQSIMIKLKFRLVLAYLLWVYSSTRVHSSNDFHGPAQSNRVLNDCKRLCRDAKTTEVPLEDSQVGVF